MKNFGKKLLTILLTTTCLLMACGCTQKPDLDFYSAKRELVRKGYTVTLLKVSEDIISADEPWLVKDYAYSIDNLLYAEGENWYEDLYLIEFEETKTAKQFYKYLKSYHQSDIDYLKSKIKFFKYYLEKYEDDIPNKDLDELEDYYKELKRDLKDTQNYSLGRSGKIVWYGNNDLIQNTK